MTKKSRSNAKRSPKKAYKSSTGSARFVTKGPASTRVLHSTSPSSASEIRETLGIPKSDVKAALDAIDSAI